MNVLFSFLILHFPFRVCVECSGYADEVGFAFTEEEVGFFLCCDAACYEDRGEYAFLDGFGHVGEEAWFCVARSEDLAGAAGEVQEVDVAYITSWVDGKFHFEDARLEDIALRIARWYDVKISFQQEELKEVRFSGAMLKFRPLSDLIEMIEATSFVRFSVKGENIIISGK